MAAIMFVLALICFAVKTFSGHIGNIDLLALGLTFMAAGHLLGGGAIAWVRSKVND